MTARDLLRESLHSLLGHRLRSSLSALGLVSGVAAVIAALAFARGAEQRAYAEIAGLGIDNVIVRAGAPGDSHAASKAHAPWLRLEHARVLALRFPAASVAAMRSVRDTVAAGGRTVAAQIAGITADWRVTSGLTPDRGAWWPERVSPARVAILSSTVARVIFGERDAIGEAVFAAGDWRTVVGVLGAGRSSDSDRLVLVPFPTLDLSLGEGDDGEAVQEIVVHVAPDTDAVRTASAIRSWVASTFVDQAGSIDVIVPRTLLETRLRAERSFHLLLLAIGTLALAVSAVGIMNIMVASVTERATEIGVRRAFGATRRAIVRQFALEAALLGSAGGAIGIPVGLIAAAAVARIADWPIAVSAASVVVSLALAVVAGLTASIYPARLAASMTPVEAIRASP